jgi:F-type H+-transporting ATPase subunit b
MKSERNIKLLRSAFWVALCILGFYATTAWAAGSVSAANGDDGSFLTQTIQYMKTNFSRATWDLVMRYVNFLILVAVIIKYARVPMISFLKGKQAETARAIERIETEKKLAEQKVREGRSKLEASRARLETIKSRIVSEGQRQKEELIATAEQESRIMIESARTRIDSQIREAYQIIREEIIESATEKAMEKLPRLMTDRDHARMVGLWMETAGR